MLKDLQNWPQWQRQCNPHQCLLIGSGGIVIKKGEASNEVLTKDWTEGDVPTLSVFDQWPGNSKRVSLNPKRGHHLKLRMLFEWGKEPLSHYPLDSNDYTEIVFSCNIKKTNVKFLEKKLNWRGTCTPFSVWSMHGSGFDEPNLCTSNCGSYFV